VGAIGCSGAGSERWFIGVPQSLVIGWLFSSQFELRRRGTVTALWTSSRCPPGEWGSKLGPWHSHIVLSAVSRCYHLDDMTTAVTRYQGWLWHDPSPASAAKQLSVTTFASPPQGPMIVTCQRTEMAGNKFLTAACANIAQSYVAHFSRHSCNSCLDVFI